MMGLARCYKTAVFYILYRSMVGVITFGNQFTESMILLFEFIVIFSVLVFSRCFSHILYRIIKIVIARRLNSLTKLGYIQRRSTTADITCALHRKYLL